MFMPNEVNTFHFPSCLWQLRWRRSTHGWSFVGSNPTKSNMINWVLMFYFVDNECPSLEWWEVKNETVTNKHIYSRGQFHQPFSRRQRRKAAFNIINKITLNFYAPYIKRSNNLLAQKAARKVLVKLTAGNETGIRQDILFHCQTVVDRRHHTKKWSSRKKWNILNFFFE